MIFTSANWNIPVRITVTARNDFAAQDPHNTTLLHTVSGDAAYVLAHIARRIDALVIDDETPGVFLLESNGRTLVTACGNTACTIRPSTPTDPPEPEPTANVTVALGTSGQTRVAGMRSARGAPARPQQLFSGNITVALAVVRRGVGSDLGSFLDEGFVANQRLSLVIDGAAAVERTILSIAGDGKSMTLTRRAPARDHHVLVDRGVTPER